MANYPSVPQVVGSIREPTFGTQVDRAESGRPRIRSMYSQVWSVFKVVHDCTDTEYDSIMSHYASHQSVSFTLTWVAEATGYTVMYANSPRGTPIEGDFRWKVETLLVQVP